jgi:hypothetical protein
MDVNPNMSSRPKWPLVLVLATSTGAAIVAAPSVLESLVNEPVTRVDIIVVSIDSDGRER